MLQRFTLVTIYKTFIIPHLDYGHTINDQAYNASFHQKLELLLFNACLAITRTIIGTLKENINEEVGLKSLKLRRWYRKISCSYKLFNSEYPHYLFKFISSRSLGYVT